jgi:hypothetical protein
VNRRFARPRIDDTGASLLIVLAFVTFVGLMTGAVLTYSGVGIRSTTSTSYRGGLDYDADAATQAGINQIRNSTFQNSVPTDCNKFLTKADGASSSTELSLTGANTNRPVAVTCQGGPNTGLDGENVYVSADNSPGQALMILAPGSGVGLTNGHNGPLQIKGNVSVNSATSGTVSLVSGSATVLGACPNLTVTAPGVRDCSSSHAQFTDPGYPVSMVSNPAAAPAPTCVKSVATFQPGVYDNVNVLNNMGSICGGTTRAYWFTPGTYYFDFRNNDLGTGSDQWLIADGSAQIVAGTPTGWDPNTAGSVPTLPGACISPLDSQLANAGVLFAFGGDSRLSLSKGHMELCGTYYRHQLPVAIYAPITGGISSSSTTANTDGTGANSGTDVAFANPSRIASDSDGRASATASLPANATGTVIVKGLVPSGGIPAGSILTKAQLVVTHNDFATTKPASIKLTVTPTPGSALTPIPITTYADANATTFHTDNVSNVPALDITSALKSAAYTGGLTDLSVKYTVTGANVATVENLDAITLVLTWTPPGFRAVRSTDSTYRDNGQALVDLSSNPNLHDLHIWGTTYTPNSVLNIFMNNTGTVVFRSGLVAWRANIDINPNGYSGPVIEVPSQTPSYTDVYFTGWVCKTGSCSSPAGTATGWTKATTARVRLDDGANVGAPSPGSRAVTVYSWTTYR